MVKKKPMASARRVSRTARELAGQSERGVAMLLAIMFMIVMAGLATVIVSTVLGQMSPTNLQVKNTQTVYAAQGGMQAALSRLRAAVLLDSSGNPKTDGFGNPLGDPSKLPCSVSGTLDPTTPSDGVGYTVTIWYYSTDPTDQTSAWQSNSSNQIACSPTTGVVSTATNPAKFALLTSTGSGNALPGSSNAALGNRSMAAVYEFKVSTINITGGYIYDYNDNSNYCLSALSATVGSTIQFLPAAQCTTANSALQLWSYGVDYEIKLTSTTTNGAAGLCITGPPSSSSSGTQNALLAACIASPSTSRWNQLWTWYGSNTWEGSNSAITGLSSWNLGFTAATPLTGQLLHVQSGTAGAFSPSTAVGAGAAGKANEEIVNYLEFGRCMDVTGQPIPPSNATHLIAYPCKQDPTSSGANITWNQKFYYTEPPVNTASTSPETIIVSDDTNTRTVPTDPSTLPSSNQFCVVPVGFPTLPATGTLVVMKACSSTTSYKIWKRVYNTSLYDTSYLFTTPGAGGTTLCLQTDNTKLDSGWSELDIVTCVANSLAQKWNAPPNYTTSELGGYKEIPG
jgi:Tfp pilus assembly protein PilX